jgi:hypothetical protein
MIGLRNGKRNTSAGGRMEKLSNEDLVQRLRSSAYVAGLNDTDSYDEEYEAKAELLSRLESGDRAKQTIKELIPMINKMLEGK